MTSTVPLDPTFSEFYALPVTAEVVAAMSERLTDSEETDLVAAHLRHNRAYFGGIDKTLSGFVVLDDEGDNFTLLDLRGDGKVWWQDHETREISLLCDSLDDWLTYRLELADAGDDADEDAIRAGLRSTAAAPATEPARTVSTVDLAGRYQWLVWLLAQPLRDRDGRAIQDDAGLAGPAVGHLLTTFPRRDALHAALRVELDGLADDPHLAIFWLLTTSLLGMTDERADVVAAIGPNPSTTLVAAFLDAFAGLDLTGQLDVIPFLSARRSFVAYRLSFSWRPLASGALLALRMDPTQDPLERVAFVWKGLEQDDLTDAQVSAAVDMLPAGLAASALRAVLDERSGVATSPAADEVMVALAASDEQWTFLVHFVNNLHHVVSDLVALSTVVSRLLDMDPYHQATVVTAQHVQTAVGRDIFGTDEELAERLRLAEASRPVLLEILQTPAQSRATLDQLDSADLRAAVAARILRRCGLDDYDPGAIEWAIQTVLTQRPDSPESVELVTRAIGDMPARHHGQVLSALGDAITSADHALVPVLLNLLDQTDAYECGYCGWVDARKLAEKILGILARFAAEPVVFDALMRLAERPATGSTVDMLWSVLFSRSKKETYVLPRLTDAQADRVARAMVLTQATHPDIHARSSARHQLYWFNHAGGEAYLIEALDEYAGRWADAAHGSTGHPEEVGDIKNLIYSLYKAVLAVGTASARSALIRRLFTERRSYYSMADTVASVAYWPEGHAEALAALRASRDGAAAGCYAFALAHFVKKPQLLVDLLAEIVDWSLPERPVARQFFHYALAVGMLAALDTRQYALVRTAHELAGTIAEAPNEPDDHSRGNTWTNPLVADRKRAAELATVLSGSADEDRVALRRKGDTRRIERRPWRKISDRKLGVLAGNTVGLRLLHDRDTGEVWFIDGDGVVRVFDGYEIVEPPFIAASIVSGGRSEFMSGVTEVSERAIFWGKSPKLVVEMIRYGDRISYLNGIYTAASEQWGLTFPDTSTAAAAMTRWRASVAADGMIESSPWYLPGRGAVLRTFYVPEPDGSYTSNRTRLCVFDGSIERGGVRFETEAEAIAAHQRQELTMLRDQGGRLSEFEWSDHCRIPQDLTVREWIQGRIRHDGRDPVWHIRALTEITNHLTEHGFGEMIAGLTVEVGAGVSDDEITAFEADRGRPVPEVLRTFWREIGWAGWRLTKPALDGSGMVTVGVRVLSPSEVLRQRPVARELGQRYLAAFTDPRAAETVDLLGSLDVLVETVDGTPVTLMAAVDRDDDRVFAHPPESPHDFWWVKSLSGMLATWLLAEFADAIEALVPAAGQFYYGQPFDPALPRRYFELSGQKPARFWELSHDPAYGVISIRSGKVGTAGSITTRRYRPEVAEKKAAKRIAARLAKGYEEVRAG